MDIDSPSALKRCNSAPIINEISPNTTMTHLPPSTNSLSRDSINVNIFSNQSRTRRFSASSSFSPHAHSPNSGLRLTPRVNQLKQEDLCNREVSHEREIHSAMQISQSYEDLSLDTEILSCKTNNETKPTSNSGTLLKQCVTPNPLFSKMLPLNLQMPVGTPLCSSPSPTRPGLGRQCFSPSMTWKTSSPSPTRKAFATRRSLSPIAMRPSSFGPLKRKFDLDDDSKDSYMTPVKRPTTQIFSQSTFMHTNSLYNSHTPTSNLVLSRSSASPIPGSLSSVGTPESMSSSDSPNFTFRPVNSPSPLSNNVDEPMQEERTSSSDISETSKSVTMKTDA